MSNYGHNQGPGDPHDHGLDQGYSRGTPLSASDPREIGGYRITARLGAGGMGRVYVGATPAGRRLAIKVLRTDLMPDPMMRRRFVREVKSARNVPGAYTAEIVDADPYGDPPWLASVLIEGPSLTQEVYRHGPLSVTSTRLLIAGVAEALIAIHSTGIAHRDLKPSNILLADDGPRVIDFGIAYAAGATELTRTGETPGTPAYMAPEQLGGIADSPTIDVFALGSVACFAATGRAAFAGDNALAIAMSVLHNEAQLGSVPTELRPLIEGCLAKDPSQRPTPRELVSLCGRPSRPGVSMFTPGWLQPATHVLRPQPQLQSAREADRWPEFNFADPQVAQTKVAAEEETLLIDVDVDEDRERRRGGGRTALFIAAYFLAMLIGLAALLIDSTGSAGSTMPPGPGVGGAFSPTGSVPSGGTAATAGFGAT